MVERVIVLPTKDNDGASNLRAIRAIRKQLLSLAGGYSEVKQRGAWRDGSVVYRDESWRVTTTVDEAQDNAILSQLPVWCEWLKQVCLYTHAVTVSADFVYPVNRDTATVA